MWFSIIWAAVRALVTGELSSWLAQRRAARNAQEVADVPLTNEEESDDLLKLPRR